jgi:hypothetical protein
MSRFFRSFLAGLMVILTAVSPLLGAAVVPGAPEVRDDGLTVVNREISKGEDRADHYLTMILKTGYAQDPKGKAGLAGITNELVYHILSESSALKIDYYTFADFSMFNFVVSLNNFEKFCQELDVVVRFDALLMYDLFNERIQAHQDQPRTPGLVAAEKLDELLAGPDHPYAGIPMNDYKNLVISDINNWFRTVYRPNNIIISSSLPLSKDFLRKPVGRDFKTAVVSAKVPPLNCSSYPVVKFTENRDNISTVFMGVPAPPMGAEGFFATVLIQRYLDEELWQEIREKAGLCYDLQVSDTYLTQSSAPALRISFQTVPGDTGAGIVKVISVFKKLAEEGIPAERITKIIQQEKKHFDLQNNPLMNSTQDRGLVALFNQKWLADSQEYLSQLGKVTQLQITKAISERLPLLKISIAGPGVARDSLKDVYTEANSLAKGLK